LSWSVRGLDGAAVRGVEPDEWVIGNPVRGSTGRRGEVDPKRNHPRGVVGSGTKQN